MIKNYFKVVLRNLLNNKIYSFVNVTGLSLGLACTMLIALYVNDEISYDRFHKNASNIYRINKESTKEDGKHYSSYTGYFPGPRFAANIPEIKTYVRFQPAQADVKIGEEVQSQSISYVDPNFLSVFSFPLVEGNKAEALIKPNAIVLTQAMAKKYFGNTEAMGMQILLKKGNSFEPFIVSGIAKDCPENSSIQFDLLIPIRVSAEDESNNGNWFNSFLSTFVVTGSNVDIKTVEGKMAQVFQSDASESIADIQRKFGVKDIGISYLLEPLTQIHLGQKIKAQDDVLGSKSDPAYSYILSGISLFILVIACINFINLTVARSVKRAKEIGIRKVIGGTRKQLLLQFLVESFLLCLLSFLLAGIMTIVVLPLFNQLSNKALSFSYLLNARLIFSYVAVFLFTALLAGFYPALVLSNYNPVTILYKRFNLGGKNYLQRALVIFQFTLASFLTIGTIAIFFQINYLTTQSLGYDDRNLIAVEKYPLHKEEALLFRQALLNNPDITSVAFRNGGFENNTVSVNTDQHINVDVETIDASYLPLLQVPLVSGRNFSAELASDSSQTILVNEAFVQQAGWSTPLNQQVKTFDNKIYNVAGVVRDYHYKPLTTQIEPQIFTLNYNRNYGTAFIKMKQGTETSTVQFIATTFKRFFPISPFAYHFQQDENAKSYVTEARWKKIIFASAVLTIFISCIGLFALSVLAAEKKTKEIGIRKVLGASVSGITAILSADFMKLVLISFLISVPLSWLAIYEWLQNYPYRIVPGWQLFGAGGLIVLSVALITISFQSVKAGISNPVKSLRTE